MRKSALAGLFACVTIVAAGSTASAETPVLLQDLKIEVALSKPLNIAALNTTPLVPIAAVPTIEPAVATPVLQPETAKYTVAENDSLSKIATEHSTTWKRLFDKNESIQHPDIISVGLELLIPSSEEVLTERSLPAPPKPTILSQPTVNRPVRQSVPKVAVSSSTQARGSSGGNTYSAGYCTWYAKNRRPDLPNSLGNANTWAARASAQGIATGSAPRPGAIGQQGMHVVYVESVNADSTVTVSEMNYRGLYVISSRTVAASNFTYIY